MGYLFRIVFCGTIFLLGLSSVQSCQGGHKYYGKGHYGGKDKLKTDFSKLDHLDASKHPTLSEKIREVLREHYHKYSSGGGYRSVGLFSGSGSSGEDGGYKYNTGYHNKAPPVLSHGWNGIDSSPPKIEVHEHDYIGNQQAPNYNQDVGEHGGPEDNHVHLSNSHQSNHGFENPVSHNNHNQQVGNEWANTGYEFSAHNTPSVVVLRRPNKRLYHIEKFKTIPVKL